MGVGRRRPVALHVDEPRRRRAVGHAQRGFERGRERARPLLLQVHLELLALVVQLAVARHGGLRLPLEEGVVQHLVVDVHAAHLGRDAVPLQRRHLLLRVGLLDRAPDLLDARLRDELRQLPGLLLHAPLALEVAALVAPVARHGHGVPRRLEEHEQLGVAGRDVVRLHDLGVGHGLLELGHGHARGGLALLFGHFLLLDLLLRGFGLLLLRGRGLDLGLGRREGLGRGELGEDVLEEREGRVAVVRGRHVLDRDLLRGVLGGRGRGRLLGRGRLGLLLLGLLLLEALLLVLGEDHSLRLGGGRHRVTPSPL
mmetsp:Transcript_12843/g.38241  ORF Transcript_12843/g.38241 Transcript_12843/m.38241 type:complete len:312 (+) Transcript_12843:803-1738(+)